MALGSHLRIKAIACTKRRHLLYEALSFEVKPGEIWHITGPNGAGKSTLLRQLAGLEMPDQGSILWNDEPLAILYSDFRQQLFYLSHKIAIKQRLTVRENIDFFTAMYPVRSDFNRTHICELLELQEIEQRLVSQLSAGQQQRLALIRLFLVDAKLYLLDEPLTALDRQGIDIVRDILMQRVAAGCSIVMTSHQALDAQWKNVQSLTLDRTHACTY